MKHESVGLSPEEVAIAIQHIKAGDTELFWRLVEPYQQSLHVTSYSLLRDANAAADIVQETMLKALKHLGELKENQSFRGWLMTIAINEARMRMRKSRLAPQPEPDISEDEEPYHPRDFADWRDIPSAALEQKEIWEAVHRALQSVSPSCREVFVLRDIQHFTVPETAAILGISEANVSLRNHRARLQMREHLAPLFRDPPSPWMPMRMVIDLPAMLIHRVVSCKTAVRELSNFINGELSQSLRLQIEAHLKYCSRCRILLDTTNKLLYLVADEKAFLPPFSANARGLQPVRESAETRLSSEIASQSERL
jgi:RNA polymerase sigma-70 factor (ECF subfamily)